VAVRFRQRRMNEPADFQLETREHGQTAVLTGDWTAVRMGSANELLGAALKGSRDIFIDANGIDRCDTSGAYGILKAVEQAAEQGKISARAEILRLLALVAHATTAPRTPVIRRRALHDLFERAGRNVVGVGLDVYGQNVFNGKLLFAIGRAIRRPARVRWAAVFSLAERAGLDAIPIIATTTFFIGAVVALLGADMLSDFGAQVFAVDLIGIAVLREFNVLVTALLLAGRSASAFAAEIGAMKMKQEIDAMQVLGIDPFDALVLPRFLALLFITPLLTFVATVAGLAGGLVVTWGVLDLGPTLFFQRIIDDVGVMHFWVGLSKSPVLAGVIAAIGCRKGLEVGGDVESLGRGVTSAVVQAIFATILIDAIFALIYMKLDL
jgi:phospholipid/cholesterol/gamma-HCH transport system permease protein